MPETKGRTIREAIAVALEGLPGNLGEWVLSQPERTAMRAYVIEWIQDYAKVRGVILDPKVDIEPELRAVIAELKR